MKKSLTENFIFCTVLGIYSEGFWIRAEFLLQNWLKEGHPICKIILASFTFFKSFILPPLEGNHKERKTNTYKFDNSSERVVHFILFSEIIFSYCDTCIKDIARFKVLTFAWFNRLWWKSLRWLVCVFSCIFSDK